MRFLLLAVLITYGSSTLGQSANSPGTDEQVIRKLDMSEVDAVLRRDFAALEKLWGQDFTVNAPNNQVVKGRAEVLKLFHAGFATYSSFVREIESLQTYENTVIVMGLETVKPIGQAPLAGQTVRRRFTNIWTKRNGDWVLTARHASIICKN